MADPFGTGAGIIGVIGLAIQITQVVVQFGMDWKDAPDDVKSFLAELETLRTVLSETHTSIILNPDFAAAFQDPPSLLISQLGPNTSSTTSTKLMLDTCRGKLESLLQQIRKRGRGHQLGWERFKGAFLANHTRESVEGLCRQCRTLNNMLLIDTTLLGVTTYKEIKEGRKEQKAIKDSVESSDLRQMKQERQDILDWLTPIDYASQQNDFLRRRQAGTGQWLIDSTEFHTWLDTDEQTLFCPGIPGAGKTILTSVVVKELTDRFSNNPTIGIAYIYCNFRQHDTQKIDDLLASLLKQLVEGQSLLPGRIKALYDEYKITTPPFDEVQRCLLEVAATYSKVFIVVDALDECQTSGRCRSKFISNIHNLQAITRAKLFATSRPIPAIEKEFKRCLLREIIASDSDVRMFLDGHMLQLPAFVSRNTDLQDEIKTEIIKAVEGMFLLAQLYVTSLEDKTTAKSMKKALQHFRKQNKGSSESSKLEMLSLAYEEAMERIDGQRKGFQLLAKNVLHWVICTKRPLTIVELQHAIAVETDAEELDIENISEIEEMVSVCAGLVTIDEESNVVRLVHYTTQEYFERTQSRWFPDAEANIMTTCITYLSFKIFENGRCQTDGEFEERLLRNPFFSYAAQYWGHHTRKVSNISSALEWAVVDFLENEAKVDASCQGLFAKERYETELYHSPRIPWSITGLHLAAYFGVEAIVKLLLDTSKIDINRKDNEGSTPLSWAVKYRRETVVKLLLGSVKVDIESKNRNDQTPLSIAARNGYEAIVKLLLDSKADIEVGPYRTPLSIAFMNGHEAVVKLLLDRNADVESKNADTETPLSMAAMNGHEAIVKLLLLNGHADTEPKEYYDRTPLSKAAERGHEAVVKLLLDGHANTESRDYWGRTPLSKAAENGQEAVVKLLLDGDADTESRDYWGRTPLSWAKSYAKLHGQETVVKLLLDK